MSGKRIIEGLQQARQSTPCDVVCPMCGAKHFIMYGVRYRCPCGYYGNPTEDAVKQEPTP